MAKKRSLEAPVYVEPLRVSIRQATQIVGESRSRLYCQIKAGKLRPVKAGAKTLFTMTELRRYVAASDPAAK